ncbi:hypothetical protein XM38_002920 [Halomicronema hongdechloris C2206]|uniref:UPF0284 protein XM38_002920 n=1 Tax=Halomicronema hongdechloris C2206 TaxID=1641165 RepID=A0A1Z3HGJ5_9CYAN|nr:TIGR00303 family protein [Halomicronema hongdechloris]ASC69365.1 hypothetical protein XM38_002920 [Halomicronema hongdechloris C2206]
MNQVHTQVEAGQQWLDCCRWRRPYIAIVFGFTATGLIPGISAAGATPADRQQTALADAEFLYKGPHPRPRYALPPLMAGASPAIITRALVTSQHLPLRLFNAGLPHPLPAPAIDLQGPVASCLSGGEAMPMAQVRQLWQRGVHWGERLSREAQAGYLVLGECVVGGTTTALAVLLGLGIDATDRVNSSHPTCNHTQKLAVAQAGLSAWRQSPAFTEGALDPLALAAAVGDPMQVVVAAMAIAASRRVGVLLAGGTQMLAVYALLRAVAGYHGLAWTPERIAVGTTRWVATDGSGDTVGLAVQVADVPLIATQLSFERSHYPQLRAYEQGFVKEGVGAGGCAIAAHLHKNWQQPELLAAVEALWEQTLRINGMSGQGQID